MNNKFLLIITLQNNDYSTKYSLIWCKDYDEAKIKGNKYLEDPNVVDILVVNAKNVEHLQ